jgi:energy-converting hydrogenase Eha subunit E
MIDLRLIGDVIIYVGAVVVALSALGAFLRIVVVRPLMKKLREELISPVMVKLQDIEKQLDDHIINHP